MDLEKKFDRFLEGYTIDAGNNREFQGKLKEQVSNLQDDFKKHIDDCRIRDDMKRTNLWNTTGIITALIAAFIGLFRTK